MEFYHCGVLSLKFHPTHPSKGAVIHLKRKLAQEALLYGALTSTFTVLSVPIFAGFAGQKVPWYTWPAAGLGLTGVGLLTNSNGSFTPGDGLCILSATVFGHGALHCLIIVYPPPPSHAPPEQWVVHSGGRAVHSQRHRVRARPCPHFSAQPEPSNITQFEI